MILFGRSQHDNKFCSGDCFKVILVFPMLVNDKKMKELE